MAAAAAASSVARAPSVRRLTGQKAAVSATFLLWLCKIRPIRAVESLVSGIHSIRLSAQVCHHAIEIFEACVFLIYLYVIFKNDNVIFLESRLKYLDDILIKLKVLGLDTTRHSHLSHIFQCGVLIESLFMSKHLYNTSWFNLLNVHSLENCEKYLMGKVHLEWTFRQQKQQFQIE